MTSTRVYKRDHPEYFEPGGFFEGKGPRGPGQWEGFCPVDFYVPDFASEYMSDGDSAEKYSEKKWWQEALRSRTGQYAFYSGCIWGDDSSWKLRYIDLSRISEGIVTDDERFGYWELPNGKLKDLIHLEDGDFRISHEMYVNQDGTVSSYYRNGLHWAEEKD